jgi:hypothetical protein
MTRFRLAAIYLLAIATGLLVGYAIEYGGGNAGIWAGAILTTLIAVAEWSTHTDGFSRSRSSVSLDLAWSS